MAMKDIISRFGQKTKSYVLGHALNVIKIAAREVIRKNRPIIVGVTGSVGKSSFIYLLDSIMKEYKKTKTTFQGNSESGLPLEILGLRDRLHNYSLLNWLLIICLTPLAYLFHKFDYELLIAEMGIDSSRPPKNMSYLLGIVKPDVGVLLSVEPVHTQQFAQELNYSIGDKDKILQAIAQEKGKIVTQLTNDSHAVINIDSPFIRALIPNISAHITTVGKSAEADYSLRNYRVSLRGTEFVVRNRENDYSIKIPNLWLAEEYGITLMSAVASAHILGMSITDIIAKVERGFIIPPGRMSILAGKNGSHIIDSSYNSSPAALTSVLSIFRQIPVRGKRIAILGDMRELGPLTEEEHKKMVPHIAAAVDLVFLVGPLMRQFVYPELIKRRIPVEVFDQSLGLGKYLLQNNVIQADDVILIKGSQNNIFLEQTALELMAKPEQAPQLLCRQSAYWEKTRQQFFQS
jgi:UDP-N-acetylmuramoyl-tripeptide--D-alanyl-D-alanine ligase